MRKHVRARKIGKGTRSAGKTIVQGVLARGGEVRTEVLHVARIPTIRENFRSKLKLVRC